MKKRKGRWVGGGGGGGKGGFGIVGKVSDAESESAKKTIADQ